MPLPFFQHLLNLANTPSFGINDKSTIAEQDEVYEQDFGTGIVDHGYTGRDSSVGIYNPGTLVVAPNQSSSGSMVESQELVTKNGIPSLVSREGGVISGGNELVTGGLGLSPNILLNLPSADGMWMGRPIWDYSAMEIVDALPVYQANRARLLDRLADIVESDEYDFFIYALPANEDDTVLGWKDTFRAQVSVPPESLLVMILANNVDIETEQPG